MKFILKNVVTVKFNCPSVNALPNHIYFPMDSKENGDFYLVKPLLGLVHLFVRLNLE